MNQFFRDVILLQHCGRRFCRSLLRLRAAQRTLNIWSAACSTGQELYSTAMVLREHFPELQNWNLQLVGTDLSEEVLQRARTARFSQIEVNRGLQAPLLLKYFQREGIHWQLSANLRNMAQFLKLNLIERWPTLPRMDVVFLRNVLIYFSPETKKAILAKVRAIMAPQAVLFLGRRGNNHGAG